MPRRRRIPKRRALPAGLQDVPLFARSAWSAHGPSIGGESLDSFPDFESWARFYGEIRAELYATRAHLRARSVADAMYEAWRRGEDPEQVRTSMLAERRANDPRISLMETGDAA